MKTWMKILLVALALLAAVGLVLGLRFYRRIQSPAELFEVTPMPLPSTPPTPAPTPVQTAAGAAEAPTPTPAPTPDAESYLGAQADLDFMQDRVNILLLGIDESAERANWGTYRTDTMMLASIDFTDESVSLISIPRDSYVKIYNDRGEIAEADEPMAKINNAFAFGGGAQKAGFAYTAATVSKLLDVPVSHYVCVNMPVVKELVDAMGGIDYDMDIDFIMNGRSYTKGMQHMNGQAVLDYCRLRKDSSDLVRVERQRRMISKILETMKDSGQIRNIPGIYRAAAANVATDLSFEQICALALVALRMDMADLQGYTVPVEAMQIGNRSCVGVKTEALADMVKELFDRREVHIDPEIDAAYLAATPALAAGDERLIVPDGLLEYYEFDGRYYVFNPETNGYEGMSEDAFAALIGRIKQG